MSDTKTTSLEQIRKMQSRGQIEPPSDTRDPAVLPDDFWDTAVPQAPLAKPQVNLRVDPDIIAFFKEQGSGHLTRMHAVLRSYVDAQTRRG